MKSLDSKTPNQDWHPNIWPPFTQINKSKPQIEVTHGKDALLFTKNPQKELIDAISSWWVTLHGHSNQYIADAIFNQSKKLEQVIFADFLHPQAKKLAERLSELTKLERFLPFQTQKDFHIFQTQSKLHQQLIKNYYCL